MRAILIGLGSGIWGLLTLGVRTLVGLRILKAKKCNCRVISVGNLQVGGAGKTPLVAQIAREASERGLSVCILTRGYQGSWESQGGVLAPFKTEQAQVCGDEAALLRDLCPQAYLGVGAHRYQQYLRVLELAQNKIDLVLLDDGFQHWKIHKDLEILALTSAQPWQVLWREHRRSIQRADLLVWTKGNDEPDTYGLPKVRVSFQQALAASPEPLWLVTGVGDPDSVKVSVLRAGYEIRKQVSFADHASYDRKTVRALISQAQTEGCRVAITEKDWVKWRDLGVAESEILVLKLNLVFEEGWELWSQKLWGQSVS